MAFLKWADPCRDLHMGLSVHSGNEASFRNQRMAKSEPELSWLF